MSAANGLYQPAPRLEFPELARWEPCRSCSGGPTPGARAMLAFALEQTSSSRSMGIYACRSVVGGSSMSVHACGRAIDIGFPVSPAGHAEAYAFLAALAPHARKLGITYIIFDRRQWSASRPPAGNRYGGAHPHRDHIHLELNAAAAAGLTLATIRSTVGGVSISTEVAMFCQRDDRDSDAVRALQRRLAHTLGIDLGAWGPDGDGVDGHFGGDTAAGLGQALGADGDVDVFGPAEVQLLEVAIIEHVAGSGDGGGRGFSRLEADERFALVDHTHTVTGEAA